MKISEKIGMALGLAALGFSGCTIHKAKTDVQAQPVVAEQPVEGTVTDAFRDREMLENKVKPKDGLYVVELRDKKYVCVNELGINLTNDEVKKYGIPAPEGAVCSWIEILQKEDSQDYMLISQLKDGKLVENKIDQKTLEAVNAKADIVSKFYKQHTMIKDPASGELVPKADYERAVALSQLRDDPQGNVYTFTVKQLEEIANYTGKDVVPGDKLYVSRFVNELKKGFAPLPDGREPIAYKAVAEYLDVEKKLGAEKIPQGVDDLVNNAEVVFVEGGRCEFEIRVKDGKNLIYSKKMNITPSRYYGGNIEYRVIKAAESAGY